MEDHNFDSVADRTLNHIAHRLKHIFSQNPGFSTSLKDDILAVSMADGGHLVISKQAGKNSLKVDTKFTDLCEPAHPQDVVHFKLDDHGRWISGKEELICYLEDGFSRYLQASQSVMLVDLEEETDH
ncbi:hypothetical protein F751_5069 [Auxenochlorella protothecoides]|uniref:Uncharacterized protein n=1 Tax=Auxenochlorella protothecoides TaxID=3075 RepID=A0A087SES3_AUXPR|nr:hypothetical protein F751_5069 [Auxenochlorella protothecoides]KFM24227.1 hypothetical protein F751_5069 [Auxenochlorella protothecoides]RMZ56213.1 hypothetical protein APUTEX25_002403 [Auxenochlorella protothecoides]|eukprot:RMZ56213.1 hypothetical protein APUTEX25_002403 [Auxenochlorella protothecoides]